MATVLRQGSRGIPVAVAQAQLNDALRAADRLNVDGAYGPKTREATVEFQRQSGLKTDGVIGSNTQGALDNRGKPTVVNHGIKHIAQPTKTTCWAASTAMMTRSNVSSVRSKTPASMIAADGGLLNSSEGHQAIVTGQAYGKIHNLRCHAPMSWSCQGFVNAIRRSPLMLDMLWNSTTYLAGQGSPGHMVVVGAVVTHGSASGTDTHLLIYDPWPPGKGKLSWAVFQNWMREVPTRTYRVFER